MPEPIIIFYTFQGTEIVFSKSNIKGARANCSIFEPNTHRGTIFLQHSSAITDPYSMRPGSKFYCHFSVNVSGDNDLAVKCFSGFFRRAFAVRYNKSRQSSPLEKYAFSQDDLAQAFGIVTLDPQITFRIVLTLTEEQLTRTVSSSDEMTPYHCFRGFKVIPQTRTERQAKQTFLEILLGPAFLLQLSSAHQSVSYLPQLGTIFVSSDGHDDRAGHQPRKRPLVDATSASEDPVDAASASAVPMPAYPPYSETYFKRRRLENMVDAKNPHGDQNDQNRPDGHDEEQVSLVQSFSVN